MVVTCANDKYLKDGRNPAEVEYVTDGIDGYTCETSAAYHFQHYRMNYLYFKSPSVVQHER